jgi:hypothetical protein
MQRAALLALVLVTACDSYDDDLGVTPFLCGESAPRCPDGYACVPDGLTGREICVREGSSLSEDFDCADDSLHEPNNAFEEATVTMLDAETTQSFAGQAVCPAGDRDLFAITITTMNTKLELSVDFETGGATLQAALLNPMGVPVASAKPVDGDPMTLTASVQNLPTGTYYASISAPVTGELSVNNYDLVVTATPP